jgi:hydroxymethylbilane synthase
VIQAEQRARPIRIGTRGSALARVQTSIVASALESRGYEVETIVVETAGDRRAPDTPWGEGAFVTAIQERMLDGEIDVAIHSAKDVPTDEDPRLAIAAYVTREEPRDALVMPHGRPGTIDGLAPGATVGTDSPRRTAFLRARRHDLNVVPLHGNVDTRLRRLDDGAVDALVLAAAGLIRLGRGDRISELVPVERIPPAPGQGAIAVQVRAADAATAEVVRLVDDAPTRTAVEAERAFLRATGGGCRAPVGALATVVDGAIEIVGGYATVDGRVTWMQRLQGDASDGMALGETLAARVVDHRSTLPGAPRVLVARPEPDGRRLAARLAELGVAPVIVPAINIEIVDPNPALDDAINAAGARSWVVLTSANGARAALAGARRLGLDLNARRWAVVGNATARELTVHGVREVWLPTRANAAALADELPLDGDRVVWLRGDRADGGFVERLVARGADVRDVIAYRTLLGPTSSRELLARALNAGPIAAVVLASPSAAEGLLALADPDQRADLLAIPATCVGTTTATAAEAAGFRVAAVADRQTADAVAHVTAGFLGLTYRR